MNRRNCWEFKKCGREPNGDRVEDLGVCPAALPGEYDGLNNGKHRGRICWLVEGTICSQHEVEFTERFSICLSCDFLSLVNEEEGRFFVLTERKKTKTKK